MGGVRIEKAAAVGPQHFDRFLRSHGTHGQTLSMRRQGLGERIALRILQRLAYGIDLRLGVGQALPSVDGLVRLEILDYALPHEYDGEENGQRQQDVQSAARQIDPKITDA